MRTRYLFAVAILTVGGTAWAGPVTKEYPVADLVVPMPRTQADAVPLGTVRKVSESPKSETPTATDAVKRNASRLAGVVAMTIKPHSWKVNGGDGKISFNADKLALVVRNTPAAQAGVAELLAALRKLQDKTTAQVVLEIRVVELPADAKEFAEPKDATATLDDEQLDRLFVRVQGDRRVNILQAPKLTVFDSQEAVVQVGDQVKLPRDEVVDIGLRFTTTPTVSADRRSVRVALKYETANIRDMILATERWPVIDTHVAEATMHIPNGKTMVIRGPEMTRETRREFGPPVLSKVPYVNRMFKNVGIGRESFRQVILVTPRIIVDADTE